MSSARFPRDGAAGDDAVILNSGDTLVDAWRPGLLGRHASRVAQTPLMHSVRASLLTPDRSAPRNESYTRAT